MSDTEKAKELARDWLHDTTVGDGYPLSEKDIEDFADCHWPMFTDELERNQ